MKQKHSYTFQIAGVPFKIKTSHDEDLVQELVGFVNTRMEQAIAMTKGASFQSAAVLTAMNIAEEFLLLKKKATREIDAIEQKANRLAIELENSTINKTKAN